MKILLMLLVLLSVVACQDEPTPEYRCEEMTAENKVPGCKIGDWWNFDLERCNSTLERCLKD